MKEKTISINHFEPVPAFFFDRLNALGRKWRQLSHLEEVCRLPEAHLAAADHVDGVLEGLVFRQLGAVHRDPLVLQARLGRQAWGIGNNIVCDINFFMRSQLTFKLMF